MAPEPAPSGGRRSEPSPKDGLKALAGRSRKHWPRRLLITTNIVVVALLALGASAYGYVQWRLGQVNRIAVAGLKAPGKDAQSPPDSAGPALTILLVGSDTRNLGAGGNAAFGSASEVTGQRSDTIMLVRVVPATSSIALMSIPRDLLVPVSGFGTTRINAAFNSGPNLLVQTIEQDLGIDINHFVVVDFATFTKISDAVGGVYQYFPTPARDLYSGLTVPHAGCVLLQGSQALGFVRSREYQYYLDGTWQYQLVPESDLARIQRQQAFIKLALKKTEHVAPTNPLALNEVLAGLTGSLTVDKDFSNSLMLNLGLDLRHTNVTGIPNWTYPTVNSTAVPGALDPVPSEDQQMVAQFLHYGMPAPKATTSPTAPATVRPASITVQVLNGSGTAGQAAQVASTLAAAGFSVSSTGDASAFDYTKSVIQYGPNGLAAAKILETKVGGGATLEESSSLTGYHLVLITGARYSETAAVRTDALVWSTTPPALAPTTSAPTTSAPTMSVSAALMAETTSASTSSAPTSSGLTTAPSEIEPDSSSYYHGQYVPPGLQPGQVPQTCPS